MENYEIGFVEFMKNPHESVRKGYCPSVIDCWSVAANNTTDVIKSYLKQFKNWKRPLDMTLREIARESIFLFVSTSCLVLYPFTFWMWGTLLYYILKGEPQRYRKQIEQLDSLHH